MDRVSTIWGAPLPRAVRLLLSAAAVAGAVWLGTRSGFYETCALNQFLAYSLAGFAFIHVRLQPKWFDILAILGATALLLFVDVKLFHHPFAIYAALGLLGLVSVGALAVRAIWTLHLQRKRLTLAFAFAVLSVSANGVAGLAHNAIAKFTPKVLDLYLADFDGSLRVQLSFWMGQVYASHHWFAYLGLFVYFAFPLTIAVVLAGQLVRDQREVVSAMLAFLITGPLGVILYGLYPALGPVYLFTDRFPWHPLTLDQLSRLQLQMLPIPGLRNSMPSLHIAWVLLALWYSRKLSIWERAIPALFLALTVCATLGTGEHYLVDLVVAFPFALFVYALSALHIRWSSRERLLGIAIGGGATVAWIALLRLDVKLFWISPLIPWTACVATIVLAYLLHQKLVRTAPSAAVVETHAAAPSVPAVSS